MIVLDYPKRLVDNRIVVPPFHTGHLGFVPGTGLDMRLASPQRVGPNSVELLFTAYEAKAAGEIINFTCTMKDGPGVVAKLIKALSRLHVNIITEESSVVDYLDNHIVHMLLDCSTMARPSEEDSDRVGNYYRDYEALCPLRDLRYIELFESVVALCGSDLLWDEVTRDGSKVPRLRFSVLHSTLSGSSLGRRTVQRSEDDKNFRATIPLDETTISQIRSKLHADDEQDLHYILLSETEDRILRAFFPELKILPKICHVGFTHRDVPGALSALTRTIADAEFNILTSLLRKRTQTESIWEAVLEYRGTEPVPNNIDPENTRQWVANKLQAVVSSAATPIPSVHSSRYGVKLREPAYPKQKQPLAASIPLKEIDRRSAATTDFDPIAALEKQGARPGDDYRGIHTNGKLRLLRLIHRRLERPQPTIFISASMSAKSHADLVKTALEGKYNINTYLQRDSEIILEQVQQYIQTCDYFIGIWHHEDAITPAGVAQQLSPWMPFELGMAMAAGKQWVVIRSSKLDKRLVERLIGHLSVVEYTDLTFIEKTVPHIVQYCDHHFNRPENAET
jgi:hypothetical protein